MFHIALFEPCIAQNTGNIIRLVSNNGCYLHLIKPLGFDLDEKKVRRAGLDYKDIEKIKLYDDFNDFQTLMKGHSIYALTTKGKRYFHQVNYQPQDILLFGAETHGLSDDVRSKIPFENHLRVPMQPNNRSINLSNTVALVSYEAWRQQSFQGGI